MRLRFWQGLLARCWDLYGGTSQAEPGTEHLNMCASSREAHVHLPLSIEIDSRGHQFLHLPHSCSFQGIVQGLLSSVTPRPAKLMYKRLSSSVVPLTSHVPSGSSPPHPGSRGCRVLVQYKMAATCVFPSISFSMLVEPFSMCNWEGVLCIKAEFNECWKVGVCGVMICQSPLSFLLSSVLNMTLNCINYAPMLHDHDRYVERSLSQDTLV